MYCVDFFRKFKKDGNFCGLDKSQVSRLIAYQDIVEKLIKQDIPEEDIYKLFSVKAAEPLISSKDDTRTAGLNYVTSVLKRGLRITQKDMQATLKLDQPESCINATEPKKQDPEKCFSPQPGSIETAPDAPIAMTLKERYSIPDQPPVANLPPLSPDADWSEVKKRDDLLLQWATNGSDPEFSTAVINGGLVTKPTPYKVIPVQLTKPEAEARMAEVVRGYLTTKDQEMLTEIMKCGELGQTYLEVFQMLIWDAADRMVAT